MTTSAAKKIDSPFQLSDPKANQRAASNPEASVWVNASAGSGKTTVLTARVTRLLLAGVEPQKILCLTYTRAGAAEMSNRVTAQFSKWASCEENELLRDLDRLQEEAPNSGQILAARRLFARVLACPGGLRIRTIHSFCQELLSRFPLEAGLPPHFALIDEQELDVLKNEVLDDLLREAASNPEDDIAKALSVLVVAQGEHGFSKMLHDAIRERGRLAEAVTKAGGKEALIKKIRDLLELPPDATAENLRSKALQEIPTEDMRSLALWLSEGTKSFIEKGVALAAILDVAPDERDGLFEDYRTLFLTAENEPRKAFANKEVLKQHPEITEMCLAEAQRLIRTLGRIEAAEIAELTSAVLSFGIAFSNRLDVRKAARAALDYDDLIMSTDKLLREDGIAPWILYKLDNGIDHVLVDEAQDTSQAQWNIVQALTAEFYSGQGTRDDVTRTLFVVGDEKQSIFSFQNADPQAFLDLREFFTERLEDAGKKLERIALHTSFRSAPAILHTVDKIFETDEVRKGVSPDPILHTPSRNLDGSDKTGRVELWPLLQPTKDETKSDGTWIVPTGYEDEHDPQAELTQQIAQKISTWLKNNETIPGHKRPIIPSDILILLRRRGRFADLMVRALKAHNVPVTGVDRMRLISQLPVMDLLAVMRFVLLPEDDLNLASLLRGPLLGLSEEQLMELAIGRSGSLWESLKDRSFPHEAYQASETLKVGATFPACVDYLSSRLREADFTTPFAFLAQTLHQPCPANAISGRMSLWSRLGDEALDPIDELLNEAQSFAQSHAPSLQNFLHWLTQADAEIKRELDHGNEQGGGQVRIMTVHASKGLEAPIVFLPDTASVPRVTDIPKFQWSKKGIPLFLTRKPHFAAANSLWQAARDRQMEEYRRLFYVALTRAAFRLYICGWQGAKHESESSGSWYHLAANALRSLDQPVLKEEAHLPFPDFVHGDIALESTNPTTAAVESIEKIDLPAWARASVNPEQTSPLITASSVADALSAATPDAAFARGRIIHRLLQSIPDIKIDKRSDAIARFLAHSRHQLKEEQRIEIADEVEKLLATLEFGGLFGADSIAEVPLTGQIDGIDVYRQVDRLCLRGDEVWIVDYKTNRPPPTDVADVPIIYKKQLDEYRRLLSAIYPDKQVRCFLLWTYAPRLMELS